MAATTKHITQAAAHSGELGAQDARSRDDAMANGGRSGVEALHPPGRRPPHRRGYLDDALDAYPPLYLYSGNPTPEQIEAAKQLVRERGLLPRAAAKVRRTTNTAQATKSGRRGRPKRAAETRPSSVGTHRF